MVPAEFETENPTKVSADSQFRLRGRWEGQW